MRAFLFLFTMCTSTAVILVGTAYASAAGYRAVVTSGAGGDRGQRHREVDRRHATLQSCSRLTVSPHFSNRLLQILEQYRDDLVTTRNDRTCEEQQACNEFVHVVRGIGLR